jgi:hypothetical protein
VRRLAWTIWGACLAGALTGVALAASGTVPHDFGGAFEGVCLMGCASVGALLASRLPGNSVGWLLLAIAAFAMAGTLIDGYGNSGVPSDQGIDAAIAWAAGNVDFIWIALVGMILPLVFPSGRLPSPRWRVVVWVDVVAVILLTAGQALQPGPLDLSYGHIENPLGIEGAETALDVITGIGTILGVFGFGASVLAVSGRLRRAEGEERLQVKWFAYVLSLIGAGLIIAAVEAPISDPPAWAEAIGTVGWVLALASLVFGLPLAAGIAILKYRLYDIDVVINRTLVYGALTAILGAGYAASVLFLQLVLHPITAESNLAIAASTLAVAAAFSPLRERVQRLVDRRFYRHHYDARQTLERFASRLRDEIDLETLRRELGAVVAQTMEPAHVSVWLRGGGD